MAEMQFSEGHPGRKLSSSADEVCEAAQIFGYFKYNGKTLEVVLETHISSTALWIKEGLIILLI